MTLVFIMIYDNKKTFFEHIFYLSLQNPMPKLDETKRAGKNIHEKNTLKHVLCHKNEI